MDISIIIVNYNVKYFLENVIHSIFSRDDDLKVEVWVVDNNSSDGSLKMLATKFPSIKVIANLENVGFSKANNQAIRKATGKYTLILNPDTVLQKNTLRICYDFLEQNQDCGALGVKMIDGSGNFLPESKRGNPTLSATLFKTLGIQNLFPKSSFFNGYYLGHLPIDKEHEIDILTGAFMFCPTKLLQGLGGFDERFFMYGEDIDLSYRIQLGGHKLYYLPHSTIIHYKGESTKKNSIQYTLVFHQAMLLFIEKHFSGKQLKWYRWGLKWAIYAKALFSETVRLLKSSYRFLLDFLIIYTVLNVFKQFWATTYFKDSSYYESVIYDNYLAPVYVLIWVLGLRWSGAQDDKSTLLSAVYGIFWSSVFIFAGYGLLPELMRSSRAVLVGTALVSVLVLLLCRKLVSATFDKKWTFNPNEILRVITVGSAVECEVVKKVYDENNSVVNVVGWVNSLAEHEQNGSLGSIDDLEDIVSMHNIDEIIMCGKDVSTTTVMKWMTFFNKKLTIRIMPADSWTIIGSPSKNSSGELYTIEMKFSILESSKIRSKKMFDILTSLGLILTFPILFWKLNNPIQRFKESIMVLMGKKSWIGFSPAITKKYELPTIKEGIFLPKKNIPSPSNENFIKQVYFQYAKNYSVSMDWNSLIRQIWK